MNTAAARARLVVLLAVAACGQESVSTVMPSSESLPAAAASAEWQTVSVDQARTRMDVLGVDTLTMLEKRAVGAGLFRLAAGVDGEPFAVLPNVVYHVIEGEAEVVVGSDTASVAPGMTAFVRGREERSFRSVTDDLLVLTLYANARPGLDDPLLSVFTRDELLEAKTTSANVLFRAIESESMTVGAFMMPREIGGDLLVRHGVDELKYVIRGGGTMEAGPDVVPVEAGFVIFVDGSLTHRFTRLWRDLDVLFVWER